jgi:hypothetical protein
VPTDCRSKVRVKSEVATPRRLASDSGPASVSGSSPSIVSVFALVAMSAPYGRVDIIPPHQRGRSAGAGALGDEGGVCHKWGPRVGTVRKGFDAAAAAYAKAGSAEKFKSVIEPDTGHAVKAEATTTAVEWFSRWIG